MDRLASIKELYKVADEQEPHFVYDELVDSVGYLLQRLERYEKALIEIKELCHSCGSVNVTPEKDIIILVDETISP